MAGFNRSGFAFWMFTAVAGVAVGSPTTVTFTNGVNGYYGMQDKAVYEPGKKSDWGNFLFGDSYMLINEQPG